MRYSLDIRFPQPTIRRPTLTIQRPGERLFLGWGPKL